MGKLSFYKSWIKIIKKKILWFFLILKGKKYVKKQCLKTCLLHEHTNYVLENYDNIGQLPYNLWKLFPNVRMLEKSVHI